jgi:hypothetical protein
VASEVKFRTEPFLLTGGAQIVVYLPRDKVDEVLAHDLVRHEDDDLFPASRYATEINHRSLSVYLLIMSVMARSLSRNRAILIEGLESRTKGPSIFLRTGHAVTFVS